MKLRISRRTVVFAGLLAAGLLFGATTQTWLEVTGLPATAAVSEIPVAGTELADTVTAMALVGLAASIALSIARRVGRYIIAVLILLAGVASLVSLIAVLVNPEGRADAAVGEVTGTTGDSYAYEFGFMFYAAMIAAILLLITGAVALIMAGQWKDAAASKKYARKTTTTAEDDSPDEFDLWDGLSQGEDPTDHR